MNNYLGSAAEGSGSDKSSIRGLCSSSWRTTERTDPGVKHLDQTKPPGGASELKFPNSKMAEAKNEQGYIFSNKITSSPFLKIFLYFFQILFQILFFSRNLLNSYPRKGGGVKIYLPKVPIDEMECDSVLFKFIFRGEGKNISNLVFLILIIPDKIYMATSSAEKIFLKVPFFTAYPC